MNPNIENIIDKNYSNQIILYRTNFKRKIYTFMEWCLKKSHVLGHKMY